MHNNRHNLGAVWNLELHYMKCFSALTATETKLRSRLDISNTIRVSLSVITPRRGRSVKDERRATTTFSAMVSCAFNHLYLMVFMPVRQNFA